MNINSVAKNNPVNKTNFDQFVKIETEIEGGEKYFNYICNDCNEYENFKLIIARDLKINRYVNSINTIKIQGCFLDIDFDNEIKEIKRCFRNNEKDVFIARVKSIVDVVGVRAILNFPKKRKDQNFQKFECTFSFKEKKPDYEKIEFLITNATKPFVGREHLVFLENFKNNFKREPSFSSQFFYRTPDAASEKFEKKSYCIIKNPHFSIALWKSVFEDSSKPQINIVAKINGVMRNLDFESFSKKFSIEGELHPENNNFSKYEMILRFNDMQDQDVMKEFYLNMESITKANLGKKSIEFIDQMNGFTHPEKLRDEYLKNYKKDPVLRLPPVSGLISKLLEKPASLMVNAMIYNISENHYLTSPDDLKVDFEKSDCMELFSLAQEILLPKPSSLPAIGSRNNDALLLTDK